MLARSLSSLEKSVCSVEAREPARQPQRKKVSAAKRGTMEVWEEGSIARKLPVTLVALPERTIPEHSSLATFIRPLTKLPSSSSSSDRFNPSRPSSMLPSPWRIFADTCKRRRSTPSRPQRRPRSLRPSVPCTHTASQHLPHFLPHTSAQTALDQSMSRSRCVDCDTHIQTQTHTHTHIHTPDCESKPVVGHQGELEVRIKPRKQLESAQMQRLQHTNSSVSSPTHQPSALVKQPETLRHEALGGRNTHSYTPNALINTPAHLQTPEISPQSQGANLHAYTNAHTRTGRRETYHHRAKEPVGQHLVVLHRLHVWPALVVDGEGRYLHRGREGGRRKRSDGVV